MRVLLSTRHRDGSLADAGWTVRVRHQGVRRTLPILSRRCSRSIGISQENRNHGRNVLTAPGKHKIESTNNRRNQTHDNRSQ